MEEQTTKNKIMDYIIKNEMTIKELADKLGCSTASIYRWLEGKKLTKMNEYKLEMLLNGIDK